MIRAIGNYVFIEPIRELTGVEVVDNAKKNDLTYKAKVLSIGDSDMCRESKIKAGDTVILRGPGVNEIKIGNDTYFCLHVHEIFGVLND